METDSLLMDDVPAGTTISHRRPSTGIVSRNGSRHVVRDSSDEELLDINRLSPDTARTNDRPQGTDIESVFLGIDRTLLLLNWLTSLVWWYGIVVARWPRSVNYAPDPVSTGSGDRSGVQLPVQETYLSI